MENFKKWFKLMWKNKYIQLFVMFIVMIIMIVSTSDQFDSTGLFLITIAIPITGMLSIIYFGFYKFWNEVKHLD